MDIGRKKVILFVYVDISSTDQYVDIRLFLQAFRKDELVDPLSDPGNIDIVSDVDFEELTEQGMLVPHGEIDFNIFKKPENFLREF